MGYNTTIGNEPWEYIDVLNACLQILLTVLAGYVFGHFQILQAKTFIPQSTRFIFYIALPLLVLRALGVGIDLYDQKSSWTFISLFLALRGFGLLLAFANVYIRGNRDGNNPSRGLGNVAVVFLALTWISTLIVGVPISKAVFGSEAVAQKYGVLAAISSFIFQLPLQLSFLEYHVGTRGRRVAEVAPEQQDVEASPPVDESVDVPKKEEEEPEESSEESMKIPKEDEERDTSVEQNQGLVDRKELAFRVLKLLVRNPVLWGITGGFFLTLSTLGPTFLHPKKPDYVPGMGWFWTTTQWFGDCVSPVSLFTMGVWMQSQGRDLFQLTFFESFLFMFSKLVVVPAIMLFLTLAADLGDEAGRAAVLIAALPISLASFSLASNYNIGKAILSYNVAMGTLLLLPTVIIWNLVLDALDLYPIAK